MTLSLLQDSSASHLTLCTAGSGVPRLAPLTVGIPRRQWCSRSVRASCPIAGGFIHSSAKASSSSLLFLQTVCVLRVSSSLRHMKAGRVPPISGTLELSGVLLFATNLASLLSGRRMWLNTPDQRIVAQLRASRREAHTRP